MIDIPKNVQKIMKDFLEEVKVILGNRLKKIMLYGSYARGDYSKSSDIDIIKKLANIVIEYGKYVQI